MELNKIYNLDCLDGLKQLDDKSIDLVVTSPPYFNLRDYGSSAQIGQESTPIEYLDNLMIVFNEIKRVLKDTGSCWVNIDDVYDNQSLMCIPDRFKIKMVENGWKCRNEIIWHKPNAMPSSAKTRFNNDYEKFYFFVKSDTYYFNTQYEPFKSIVTLSNGMENHIATKYKDVEQEKSVRQGIHKSRGQNFVILRKNLPTQDELVTFLRGRITSESISQQTDISRSKVDHWFRRDNSGFAYPSVQDWDRVRHLLDDGSEEFKQIDSKMTDTTIENDDVMKNAHNGRIKRAVWSINTKPLKECHYAPFPEDLIDIPIKACCDEGGVVLDPFMGSGTTAKVALLNNCHFIGFEVSKEYCEIANKRIYPIIVDKNNELW